MVRFRKILLKPLFLAITFIVLWQGLIFTHRDEIPSTYRIGNTGLVQQAAIPFLYFYYHFGIFPAAVAGIPAFLKEGISPAEVLAGLGGKLRNEFNDAIGFAGLGDYARIFLFYPSLWLGAAIKDASVIPATAALFLLSLILLVLAFSKQNRLAQGVAIVVLVGSSSFQTGETYAHGNVFSLTITISLLVLALNLEFFELVTRLGRRGLAIAAGTGLLLGCAREIRPEPMLIIFSLVILYGTMQGPTRRHRALLVLALLGSFAFTGLGWKTYFEAKRAQAIEFVREHGGVPDPNPAETHHPSYHAFFCGLGDFGQDRGYAWDDMVAFDYGLKRMHEQGMTDLVHTDLGRYRHKSLASEPYYLKPTCMPEYNAALLAKIKTDVLGSPLWFGNILLKRIGRIFSDSTPLQLNVVFTVLELPLRLWLIIPILILFFFRRRFFEIKVILFFSTLSVVPFVLYSGAGTTYYQIAHLVGAGLLAGNLNVFARNK